MTLGRKLGKKGAYPGSGCYLISKFLLSVERFFTPLTLDFPFSPFIVIFEKNFNKKGQGRGRSYCCCSSNKKGRAMFDPAFRVTNSEACPG